MQVDRRVVVLKGHSTRFNGINVLRMPVPRNDTSKIATIFDMLASGSAVRFVLLDTNEPAWEANLNGSRAALYAVSNCITSLTSDIRLLESLAHFAAENLDAAVTAPPAASARTSPPPRGTPEHPWNTAIEPVPAAPIASASPSISTWRCRDPQTNFVYERHMPCAKGDVALAEPSAAKLPTADEAFPLAPSESREEIPLIEDGGVYKAQVVINGVLPLDFMVDSGASDVSLPEDVVSVLKRTGTLSSDDRFGSGSYQLADGTVVQEPRFYLHELSIGAHVLKHVEASVGGRNGIPLLGQSFLKRFGSVQVDNTRHVLVLGAERADTAATATK
jgi:hypothetical protein